MVAKEKDMRELLRQFCATCDSARRRQIGRSISEAEPGSCFALLVRGLLAAEDNPRDLSRAIADYGRAIEKNPDFWEAYHARAKTLAALKDYDRAIEDSTRAISLNSESLEAYQHRGNLYARKGDLKSAMRDFSRAKILRAKKGSL